MARRRYLTAAAMTALLLAAVPTAEAVATASASPLSAPIFARPVPPLIVDPPLADCEHALERTRHPGASTLAIVGASFTAGVGPGSVGRSWAGLLARMLHTDAVVDGVPGAGYVRRGQGHLGPVTAELTRIGLHSLAPSLVIIQAGHDDMGVPAAAEEQRVKQTIAMVHAQAPRAKIALLTVFTRHHPTAAAYTTDHAIVAAARAVDRAAIIIDPLAAHWSFPRARGGLHPTEDGSTWIARQVARALQVHGIQADAASNAAPVVCDSGISSVRFIPRVAMLGTSPHIRQPQSSGAQLSATQLSAAQLDGSHSRISVPPPAGLSASIMPPWASVTWRTMARPSPEPGVLRAEGAR
jgi:lysophospholipase L1-like esterase